MIIMRINDSGDTVPTFQYIQLRRDLTSIVTNVQSLGIFGVLYGYKVATVFMQDGIWDTWGLRWRSINHFDIFSVGPPHPLTIGLTAMEDLFVMTEQTNHVLELNIYKS